MIASLREAEQRRDRLIALVRDESTAKRVTQVELDEAFAHLDWLRLDIESWPVYCTEVVGEHRKPSKPAREQGIRELMERFPNATERQIAEWTGEPQQTVNRSRNPSDPPESDGLRDGKSGARDRAGRRMADLDNPGVLDAAEQWAAADPFRTAGDIYAEFRDQGLRQETSRRIKRDLCDRLGISLFSIAKAKQYGRPLPSPPTVPPRRKHRKKEPTPPSSSVAIEPGYRRSMLLRRLRELRGESKDAEWRNEFAEHVGDAREAGDTAWEQEATELVRFLLDYANCLDQVLTDPRRQASLASNVEERESRGTIRPSLREVTRDRPAS